MMLTHNTYERSPLSLAEPTFVPEAFADERSNDDKVHLGHSRVSGRQVAVMLHDDRQHTLRYCKALLCEVFGMSETAATVVTWVINTEGRAIAWTGSRDEAARLCEAVLVFQQRVDEHRDEESQSSLDAGHPPMRASIEELSGGVDQNPTGHSQTR